MLAEEKEFQSEAKMPYTSKIDEDLNLLVADFCYQHLFGMTTAFYNSLQAMQLILAMYSSLVLIHLMFIKKDKLVASS